MSLQFAVVHEARADFETATELADRVLCESIGWLDGDLVVHQRTWLETSPEGHRLTWKAIKKLASNAGITALGHFNEEPILTDAAASRRAILFLRQEFPDVGAIVLIRDQDDQPQRQAGLEQARTHDRSGIVIVIGLAIVERESWVISGFDPDPENEAEEARLQQERQQLGFDPRSRSHELTACKDDNARHSPKRVLRVLSGDDRDRERRCWRETDLSTLRDRGDGNGLAAFLREVREILAPLIGHVSEG